MKKIVVALAGNPNSGKTSVFNRLTGSHQKVGNWPGVTVEKKVGYFFIEHEGETYEVEVVDLPGAYSLVPSSTDEAIARDYLLSGEPDVVVDVVDATNLHRNLFFTVQLLEAGLNVVLALNMMDMVESSGWEIKFKELSRALCNVPVVPLVAREGRGIEDLKKQILLSFLSANSLEGELHSTLKGSGGSAFPCLLKVDYGILEKFVKEAEAIFRESHLDPLNRWRALAFLAGDDSQLKGLPEQSLKRLREIYAEAEKAAGTSPCIVIAERRYGFIEYVLKKSLRRKATVPERMIFSDMVDKVLAHPIAGMFIFLGVMLGLFKAVFSLGAPLVEWISFGFDALSSWVESYLPSVGIPEWVASFLSQGVIAGVGAVLSFLPYIMLLFFFVSILEDSGYMARAAFVMDGIMRYFGLSGKAFIPLVLGFGCNVPAVMATRTLSDERDRIATILAIPFMSCSARLPVYLLFASVLFKGHEGLVVFSLYLLGIVIGFLTAFMVKKFYFRSPGEEFVIELPPYRLPWMKNVFMEVWLRTREFLTKAGTIILLITILIWILASLPVGVEYASENSLIGRIGKELAVVFKPAGFGFWQAAVALIFGILAKEVVIATFGAVFGVAGGSLAEVLKAYFTPASAISFLVMTLLYMPCTATIAVIKQEAGTKWALISTLYSLIVGWLLAVLSYHLVSLFV